MMGPDAGEEREGQPEKKERNSPMFFCHLCAKLRWGGGVRRRREGERASADGPHRLTGWTNVDVFSPGSDIYS